MSTEYKCQECGDQIGYLSSDELERRLATGDVVKGSRLTKKTDYRGDLVDEMTSGVFGICRACKRKERTLADSAGSDKAADAQTIRIRDRAAMIRKIWPDLPLEEVIHAAVEDEFDPRNESDRGFRAYLLGEGAPKDAEVDAAARRFMENLPENSLTAPADNPKVDPGDIWNG